MIVPLWDVVGGLEIHLGDHGIGCFFLVPFGAFKPTDGAVSADGLCDFAAHVVFADPVASSGAGSVVGFVR